MSNPKSFLPPELKRSIDLLTAKLPEIQAFAEQQTAKAQEIIDACSAFPRQIGLPSIPSSTASKEEPGERQHAYAISPFCNLGRGDEKGAECTGPSALRPACHEGAFGMSKHRATGGRRAALSAAPKRVRLPAAGRGKTPKEPAHVSRNAFQC